MLVESTDVDASLAVVVVDVDESTVPGVVPGVVVVVGSMVDVVVVLVVVVVVSSAATGAPRSTSTERGGNCHPRSQRSRSRLRGHRRDRSADQVVVARTVSHESDSPTSRSSVVIDPASARSARPCSIAEWIDAGALMISDSTVER